jgi:hypothetical protein
VYGGETVTPPQYGKVFIAVKPKSGGVLTTGEKVSIEQDIRRSNSIVTIVPKVVDPEYTDLVFETVVTYDADNLPVSSSVLKTLAVSYIFGYSGAKLEQFGKDFYLSKMQEGLNNLHPSVLGVYSKIKLRKTVDASVVIKNKSHEFNFGNPIFHPHENNYATVFSNRFGHRDLTETLQEDCMLEDNGSGVVNVVRVDPNNPDNHIVVYPSVGTVDYAAGIVRLNSKFVPDTSTSGSSAFPIIVSVEPEITNIYANENQILRVNTSYTDSVVVRTTTETAEAALNSLR